MQKLKLNTRSILSKCLFFASLVVIGILAIPGHASADRYECKPSTTVKKCIQDNPITRNLQEIVNFLSAGVGILVVAVIIIGGIQYIVAGENPSAINEAKKRITNGLVALVAFILTFALLQYLIPGGIFG